MDVARSGVAGELEAERERRLAGASSQYFCALRYGPSRKGQITGHSPTGRPLYATVKSEPELWTARDVGSYESIRLAWQVWKLPTEEYRIGGKDWLEEVIDLMKSEFPEGSFRLCHANAAALGFETTRPGARLVSSQHALIDRLKKSCFRRIPSEAFLMSVDAAAPGHFLVGAV